MKTDDLIRTLAADTVLPRPLGISLMLGLIPSLALAIVAVWIGLGFRPDLTASLAVPVSVIRILLTAGLGIAAMRIALLLARPEGRDVARLWPLAVVGAVAAGLFIWAYVTTPAEARQMATVGKTMVTCLVTIPLLSVLPVAAILFTLHRGATTAPALAGFAAGLAGSGMAAAIYALHCTEDSPLFYVTWYGLAIMAVTLVSTAVGARLLRW
ncbi:MAG: NrsF family protein [Paracoccaceae bacterium]